MITRRNFIKGVATGLITLWWERRLSANGKIWEKTPRDETFWKVVREEFPLTRDRIYFNAGGLGPSPRTVIDTVFNATMKLEEISETGHHLIERVREKAAKFLGANLSEVAFTRNCTEGMNIIARGIPLKRGDEVLMTTHEHPGGAMPWLALMKEKGVVVKTFEPGLTPEDNLNQIEANITRRTRVLSISHITCTTGLLFPAKEVCQLAKSKGLITVLDGAQVVGMIPIDLHEIGCDFYATSGHKWLLGPKGTGLVYVSEEMRRMFKPTFVGAYSDKHYDLDQRRLEYKESADCTEYGTRNTALVLGLGSALDFLSTIGMKEVAARGASLAAYLKQKLREIPNIKVLTPMDPRASSSIVTFKVKDRKHTEIQHMLVHKYKMRTRPVGEHHINAIRVSLHLYNNFEEINRLLKALGEIIEKR